jgi:hypothetical protein
MVRDSQTLPLASGCPKLITKVVGLARIIGVAQAFKILARRYQLRGYRTGGSVAAAECSRADPFLQLAELTSGQAKNSTRALKKTRASLTGALNDRTFRVTKAIRLSTPAVINKQFWAVASWAVSYDAHAPAFVCENYSRA